jgi:hypothetical protein
MHRVFFKIFFVCTHAGILLDYGFQFGRFVAFSATTVVLRVPWYE